MINTPSVIRDKFKQLLQGDDVVCSDSDLDELWKLANNASKEIRSIPNPNQCGTLDIWLAWIGERANSLGARF